MAKVKVYSTPTCPWCQKLKAWLKEKDIDFDDVDVSEDQEAAQEMMKKSGQMGVPQTEIDGRMIVGFNKEAIEAELKGGDGENKEEDDSKDGNDDEEGDSDEEGEDDREGNKEDA